MWSPPYPSSLYSFKSHWDYRQTERRGNMKFLRSISSFSSFSLETDEIHSRIRFLPFRSSPFPSAKWHWMGKRDQITFLSLSLCVSSSSHVHLLPFPYTRLMTMQCTSKGKVCPGYSYSSSLSVLLNITSTGKIGIWEGKHIYVKMLEFPHEIMMSSLFLWL